MSNKKAIKFIRFLENVWMVVAITTAAIGVYETISLGIVHSYMFFMFSIVAGILYTLRRRQRIGMEEETRDD
ncbi:MAG: hypothetical protein JKY18_01335 [Flavobacteriales bacterium]|nr:hypothetical protein [Flavobacteriales bacterium]PCH86889.1 MAG: hypothetical protein COB88_06620 [Flavobacteriales bacterium]